MIKLACNYYNETIELLKEDKISLDYLKLPTLGRLGKELFESKGLRKYERFMKKTSKICPVMIHGICANKFDIGSKDFTCGIDEKAARRIHELSAANVVSIHLCGIDTTLPDCENKKIILENLSWLKEFLFPFAEYISLENADGNPYMNNGKFGVVINPVFISEIVHESGLDFLLDISHAYGSAKSMNMDFYSYMQLLPLDKLHEIHINGWLETENNLMAHVKTNELAYEALEMLLEKHTPQIITLEYGREDDRINAGTPTMSYSGVNERAKEEMYEQIIRLKKIIEKVSIL